jgi:hypothetical protein
MQYRLFRKYLMHHYWDTTRASGSAVSNNQRVSKKTSSVTSMRILRRYWRRYSPKRKYDLPYRQLSRTFSIVGIWKVWVQKRLVLPQIPVAVIHTEKMILGMIFIETRTSTSWVLGIASSDSQPVRCFSSSPGNSIDSLRIPVHNADNLPPFYLEPIAGCNHVC